MSWSQTVLLTLAATLAAIAFEFSIAALRSQKVFTLRDTLTNISAYLVYLVIAAIYGYTAYLIMTYLQLAFKFNAAQGLGIAYWPCLIVGEDFCFYWFHRLSHKIGLLWASHVTHHSSNQFNLSVGLRQTWVPFVALPFWLPLAVAGFDPVHILTVQSASLAYQFFMHTQVINLPQTWGYIFNTPSHHRVHHGRNGEYLDRNFAGVLIVWDRLFGTFQREAARVSFGIDTPPPRGEVVFAELGGFADWFLQLIGQPRNIGTKDVYGVQKFSLTATVLLLGLCAAALAFAIKNPRWFL